MAWLTQWEGLATIQSHIGQDIASGCEHNFTNMSVEGACTVTKCASGSLGGGSRTGSIIASVEKVERTNLFHPLKPLGRKKKKEREKRKEKGNHYPKVLYIRVTPTPTPTPDLYWPRNILDELPQIVSRREVFTHRVPAYKKKNSVNSRHIYID